MATASLTAPHGSAAQHLKRDLHNGGSTRDKVRSALPAFYHACARAFVADYAWISALLDVSLLWTRRAW